MLVMMELMALPFKVLTEFPTIPSGLVYSLNYPSLVSAGADCYRGLLKEISEDQWHRSFYVPVKTVIIGSDR
jgi:hypothetical protein